MTLAASALDYGTRFRVGRDASTIGRVLRRIRHSQQLVDLCLFGRRKPARMLKYVDRRSRERMPVQMPIYVTAVDFDGNYAVVYENTACERLAFTKDVSLRGIGFTHDEPLEANYAIVTFDLLDAPAVSLLLEVRWSNLERGHCYMSGGRFFGVAQPSCQ